MLRTEQNKFITETGPGTPMGALLRRYWVPVMHAEELPENECPPVRVKIMSERLLAWRDTQGRYALTDEFCAHRGISLWFGRNEENGLRCPYHGWKYDHTGQCIDVPSEPAESGFCNKIKLKSYPLIERGGILWAYMGPPELQPPFPEFEWTLLSASHCYNGKRWQECNYLQAMEGGIDTSHVSYVHRFEVDEDPMHQGTKALEYIKADGNVNFEIERTDFGLTLYGRRLGDPDSYYWRITQWLFPWYTLIPPFGEHALGGHVWVPIDDRNCWAWSINYHPDKPLSHEELHHMAAGKGIHCEYEPGTFRPRANKDNDYLIDRRAQKEKRAYSGVFGISVQDASLQESMGPIQNHAAEKLLPTDRAIVMARRMLHEAATAMEAGAEPPALNADKQRVRAAGVLLPRGDKPQEWARVHLSDAADQPVYSI
jgi:phthalate 4,5-dioxygenase